MERATEFVGGEGRVVISGSGGYQYVRTFTDSEGRKVTRIARFDINPNSPHVQEYGPHLNLETQINGKTVRKGELADPHTPIDSSTVRMGDIP